MISLVMQHLMEVAVQAQADSTLVTWAIFSLNSSVEVAGSFFDGMFGGGGRRQARGNAHRKGRDLEASVRIDMLEAYKGTKKDIEYNYKEACDSCHGSGAKAGTTPETCTNCGGSGQGCIYTAVSSRYA